MTTGNHDSRLAACLESEFDGEFVHVPDREFRVTDYGADGNGRNTEAIQATLNAAADDGGGRVVVPTGTYRSGALFVPSNVEFYLAEGAVLRAVRDDDAYPSIPTRVAGIEMEWPAALLTVRDAENVRITGEGTIDGSGDYWWETFQEMREEYEQRGLRWAVDYDCERVRPVLVQNSRDVRLSGVTIERQGFWAMTMTYCERVRVDGLTVRGNVGGYGPSTDGINVDSSRDVLIEDCDVSGNDDCFCLKAGRDADGLRVNRPTENVVIRRCRTGEGGGLVTIGSETAGGVRNVEVSDVRGEGTNTGIRFKSAKVRGGVVENVRFRDLEMDDVRTVFEWNLDWHPDYSYPTIPEDVPETEIRDHWETLTEPVEPPERGIPEVRNVVVEDLRATNADRVWAVTGYPEQPIHDVRLARVDAEAPQTGSIAHAEDWTMEAVTVRTDDQLSHRNCRNLDAPDYA